MTDDTTTDDNIKDAPPPGFSEKLKILHWIIAPLMLFMLGLGLVMVDLERTPFRGEVYAFHKSLGLVILLLAAVRLTVRLTDPKPGDTAHKPWERMLAKAVHAFLYIGMVFMPLSGWAMSSAAGRPVALFGLPMPPLVQESEAIRNIAGAAHEYLAWAVILAFGLHVAGVFKHAVIDRDDTILRIVPACWLGGKRQ